MRPLELAHLPNVNESADIGAEVRARRERLRMTISELAGEASVSRDTLSDLEAGAKTPQPKTVGKVIDALDRVETEMFGETGADIPAEAEEKPARLVRYEIRGNFGVSAVVEGAVEDMEALESSVARLIAGMQGNPQNG